MAETQSSLPAYLYFDFALSQVPAHFTNATCFSPTPASTPMIEAILSATGCPPTGHAPTGASPAAIALASASQPANPQPPQLFPGSNAKENGNNKSGSTDNYCRKDNSTYTHFCPS